MVAHTQQEFILVLITVVDMGVTSRIQSIWVFQGPRIDKALLSSTLGFKVILGLPSILASQKEQKTWCISMQEAFRGHPEEAYISSTNSPLARTLAQGGT